MDIVYKKDILKDIEKGLYILTTDVNTVKGLYYTDTVKINLSALQWSLMYFEEDEKVFITDFTNTVTHEYTHLIIDNYNISDIYTLEGEEYVCRIMANQD